MVLGDNMFPTVVPGEAEYKQKSQNGMDMLLIQLTQREPARICENDIDETHPREGKKLRTYSQLPTLQSPIKYHVK